MHFARLLLLVMLLFARAAAQPRAAEEVFTPDHESAIARGLAFLARQQQPDGSFMNREPGSPDNAPRFGGQKVALTGLSLLAFLSAGRVPDVGKHGVAVRNGVEFLLKSAPDDGYFGKVDGSRMYGHAIVTLALSEVCGMEADARQRKRLRTVLDRCVKILLTAQSVKKDPQHAGGWRYEIGSGDSDLSVTGWCALALRAANNAGVDVPRASADRAAAFVLKCWRPEKNAFAYQPGGEITPAMTGVGILCLDMFDRGQRPETALAATWLIEHPVTRETEYSYYACYYATHAAYRLGGDTWLKIWSRTQAGILQLQQKEKGGCWPASKTANEPGKTYATAMSVLTLALPLRLLPVYQR